MGASFSVVTGVYSKMRLVFPMLSVKTGTKSKEPGMRNEQSGGERFTRKDMPPVTVHCICTCFVYKVYKCIVKTEPMIQAFQTDHPKEV